MGTVKERPDISQMELIEELGMDRDRDIGLPPAGAGQGGPAGGGQAVAVHGLPGKKMITNGTCDPRSQRERMAHTTAINSTRGD
jgi:hypothetical protein